MIASRRVLLRFLPSVAICGVLGVLGPHVAGASIMMALDLPDLVRQAEHIAIVEVASVRAAWDERHERIYSTIDLNVIEHWKGAPVGTGPAASRLTVVQPGGTVGDMSMTVMGLGTFVPGERSLVFLRGPVTRAQLVGMTQGKRALRYEPASRHWLVVPPDLRQTKLLRPTAAPAPLASRASSSSRLSSSAPSPEVPPLSASRETPLDDLRVEVKRLLGAGQP